MVHCRAENTSLNLAVCWVGLQKKNQLMVSNIRPKFLYIDIGWVCNRKSCSHRYPVQSCSPKFRPSHLHLEFCIVFVLYLNVWLLMTSKFDSSEKITWHQRSADQVWRSLATSLALAPFQAFFLVCYRQIQFFTAKYESNFVSLKIRRTAEGLIGFPIMVSTWTVPLLNGNFPFLSKSSEIRLFWRSDVTCGYPDLGLQLFSPNSHSGFVFCREKNTWFSQYSCLKV